MRVLSLLIMLLSLLLVKQQIKSPHGSAFKIGCGTCHSTQGWYLDTSIYSFDHNTTRLPLKGQHNEIACKLCHKSLVFTDAGTECNECHPDIHQGTTGSDCSRCHTPQSWLVSNINEIHRTSRFPLLGAHIMADCNDCHKSADGTRFDISGVNCIDCHRNDYNSTEAPNHIKADFSEDCSNCHQVNSFQWTGAGFNHNFFALAEGHSGLQCNDCHTSAKYSDTSPDCNSCHQDDYLATTNPNHAGAGFPVTCNTCHTITPGWKPADYKLHDKLSFPIYSGRHAGTWNACNICHTSSSNYSVFTCLTCHEHNKTEMDKEHEGRAGYSYTSPACLSCHPTGNAEK